MAVQIRCMYPDYERAYQWADALGALRHADGSLWWQVRFPDGTESELPQGRLLWTYEFRDEEG